MKKRHKAFSLIELSIVILIVGTLIAGTTQSSSLVRKFRVRSAQSLTKSSGVSSIKDLVFWSETTLSESVTSATNSSDPQDGDAISAWNDINPQEQIKNNLAQATSVNRPTYKQTGINNLPSLTFNGTSSILTSTTVPIPAADDSYTMFVVWSTTSFGTADQFVISMGGTSNNSIASLYLKYGSSSATYGFSGFNNDLVSPSVYLNKVNITGIKIDNSTSTNLSIYKESLTATTGATTGTGGNYSNLDITSGSFVVGAQATSTSYQKYFTGNVSEIIIFDRTLIAEEIKAVMTYLGKKYNVSVS